MSAPEFRARFAINVIENSNHEILLLKRSLKAELGPGRWGFPAGHIENDETPIQCARRELFEEIGPNHQITFIKEFGPVKDHHYGGIYQVYLFHQRWLGGEIQLNPEHTDYAWVSEQEYKKYPTMDGMEDDLIYLNIWNRVN